MHKHFHVINIYATAGVLNNFQNLLVNTSHEKISETTIILKTYVYNLNNQ